jgi:hypothetical protein
VELLLCFISWECATESGLMESYGSRDNVNQSGNDWCQVKDHIYRGKANVCQINQEIM